jgi:thiol-disulfide isomerase/thioredoxin
MMPKPFALSRRILLTTLAVSLIGVGVAQRLSSAQVPYAMVVPAPELVGGPWLNTPDNKPIKLADRKGKVTIVEFWTFGCINCQRNLPAYARWHKKYADKGVAIIGVHTPETESEKVWDNVQKKVKELGITYPVLFDLKSENWKNWKQHFWPTVYLIDKKGRVRYGWEGELDWKGAGGEAKMAARIDLLLDEK